MHDRARSRGAVRKRPGNAVAGGVGRGIGADGLNGRERQPARWLAAPTPRWIVSKLRASQPTTRNLNIPVYALRIEFPRMWEKNFSRQKFPVLRLFSLHACRTCKGPVALVLLGRSAGLDHALE